MANRYGVNLGQIMKTTSALKTAKLRRNKMQKDIDRGNLEDEAYGDFIAKDSPKNMIAAADDNQDGIIDDEEKLSAKRKTGMKYNALSKIEDQTEKRRAEQRIIDKDAKTEARDKREHDAEISYYKRMGSSDEEAKVLTTLGEEKAKKMTDTVAVMEEKQQYMVLDGINKGGQELQSIMEAGAQNPQAGEAAYQKMRKTKQDQVNQLYKDKRIDEAEQAEEALSGMAETLIKEDGSFDMAKSGKYLTNLTKQERSIKEAIEYKKNSSKKNKSKDPTYSQVKTHLREVRKQAQSVLARDADLDTKEELEKKDKVIEDAVRIAKDNPSLTVEEAIGQAKGGKSRNAIKTATKKSTGKQKKGYKYDGAAPKKHRGKTMMYKGNKVKIDDNGIMTVI